MKMRKKIGLFIYITVLTCFLLAGCGRPGGSEDKAANTESDREAVLENGVYEAEFDTDSSMFHVNEACDGKGTLTVKDGRMTIHVSLVSKNIVRLFAGTAEDAQQDGAEVIEPTTDTVTYSDGISEEVYGFDIPVPALNEEFEVALVGTKGIWYDHKVSVSNPEKSADSGLADGEYTIGVTLEGGSGKGTIASPTKLSVRGGGMTAEIIWSSPNYDYMLVDGEKYLPVNDAGDSVFEIPVAELDRKIKVTADTTAMSKPHEIEYTLNFDSVSVKESNAAGGAGASADLSDKSGSSEKNGTASSETEKTKNRVDMETIPAIDGLTYKETVSPDSAACFRIYRYEKGYSVIRVDDGNDYLLVPEGGEVPKGLSGEYTVLRKPVNHIYLAASAVMSLFDSIGALEDIRLSGLNTDAWYIENAKAAMEKGDILFAGKYSEPDYELLLSEKCDLAVESTMLLHSPEVQEKLKALNIPVLIDRSSYESDPLGRTEWIKLYGELTDKREEAETCFEEQKAYVEELADFKNTKKTVAFFYINDNGMVVTRKSSDYFAKMIEDAGGQYIFDEPGDESGASSAVTMPMEEFYASAVSADYLIYNATIGEPMDSVEDLLKKSSLFADFKAVKDGNVWCTGKYLYQATNVIGSMIQDVHIMLTEEGAEELSFMTRLR